MEYQRKPDRRIWEVEFRTAPESARLDEIMQELGFRVSPQKAAGNGCTRAFIYDSKCGRKVNFLYNALGGCGELGRLNGSGRFIMAEGVVEAELGVPERLALEWKNFGREQSVTQENFYASQSPVAKVWYETAKKLQRKLMARVTSPGPHRIPLEPKRLVLYRGSYQ